MRARFLIIIGAVTGLAHTPPAQAAPPAAAVDGAAAYRLRCGSCHTLDRSGAGPAHRGVAGRRSGAVPDYNYSAPLRAAGIVWTRETLDKWLQGPRKMVPGTRMFTPVPDPAARTAIIDYLMQAR